MSMFVARFFSFFLRIRGYCSPKEAPFFSHFNLIISGGGSTRSPPQGVSWSTERAYVPWGLVRISGVLGKHLRKGTLYVAGFLCLVQPIVDSMDLYYTHTIIIYILDIQLVYSPRLLDFCFDQSQRLCLMQIFRHVGWFGKVVAWRFWVPQCDFGSDSICDSAVDALLDLCPAYLGGLDVHLQAPLNCKWLLYWMFSNWCQRTVDVKPKWSTKGYHGRELLVLVFPPSNTCLAPFIVW